MNRTTRWLATSPAMALVAGLVIGPLALLLRISLYQSAKGKGFYTPGSFSLATYAALADPHLLSIISVTIFCGLTVATVATLVAYPLGLFVRSLSQRSQVVALGLILAPKTAGLLAILFGLQRWLPRGTLATIIAEVYLVLPYSILVIYAQLHNLDPTLLEAARGLGAGPWQAFRRVTLPLSLPGILLAFQFTLMWGLGAFLGPVFLGGPNQTTLAVELFKQAFEYGRWPLAAAEAVGLLLLVACASICVPALQRWRKAAA